ncbi:MAG: S8/S53 family peptidase [Chloroflexi bacterium]|nr:S8/S53 family peptidase [Chloroflexota bacterium]
MANSPSLISSAASILRRLLILILFILLLLLIWYLTFVAFRPHGAYLPGDILITGEAQVLQQMDQDNLLNKVGGGRIKLSPKRTAIRQPMRADLWSRLLNSYFPGRQDRQQQGDAPGRLGLASPAYQPSVTVEFRQYKVDNCQDGSDPATCAIRILESELRSRNIFVEHNYIVGHPWQTGSDPWQTGSDPAGGLEVPKRTPLTQADFNNQWAFTTPSGIGLNAAPAPLAPVSVCVLDTLPFSPADYASIRTKLKNATPAWDITFAEVPLDADLTPPPALGLIYDLISNVSNHGFFASSLIHAVEPSAGLHLVRVLNNDGKGSLNSLQLGFNECLSQPLPPKGRRVLNLSLGTIASATTITDVFNIHAMVTAAFSSGAVVVAASGNDSKFILPLTSPPRPDIKPFGQPAAFSLTIGVGGTNANGGRSCFANSVDGGKGDVSAPAGDGPPNCVPASAVKCAIDPKQCLIGAVAPVDNNGGTGYGYWRGTSFASPLVAGSAARILAQSTDASIPVDALSNPLPDYLAFVRAKLEKGINPLLPPGDPQGLGKINIKNSLP